MVFLEEDTYSAVFMQTVKFLGGGVTVLWSNTSGRHFFHLVVKVGVKVGESRKVVENREIKIHGKIPSRQT